MFKQLKNYYVIVSLPFVILLSGAVYFFDALKGTIAKNPHPQINYIIFYIILFGGGLILLSVHRLVQEARTIVDYSKAVREKRDVSTIQELVNNFTGDISYVLQMVATSYGRPISHQEQVAIEHELTAARSRLMRRNGLPQYLSGLLVGMGLLGTFVGLLSTLSDISVLISSFAELDMATASPLLVFRTMIERMKAPMQSMSIAFSASMFGLLGSIILGLMMLGIRRLQGDISSLLGSEVAKHIEIALSYEATGGEGENATPATVVGVGGAFSGEESKTLGRIEERLAELGRVQQRMLAVEIEDFGNQRAEIVRTLAEQTEANNSFRAELQQLGRQFSSVLALLERGNSDISSQVSEMTVHLAADAKESHKLLTMQMDEQKRLRDSLDSCKIEERLAEAARMQQRMLGSEIDDFQKQRADMLRTMAEQSDASNAFRSELQQFGRQLAALCNSMEKGSVDVSSQIGELIVHMTADARESQKLLAMQINEQVKLRESLDWRSGKQ
jgi:hypothetical protein